MRDHVVVGIAPRLAAKEAATPTAIAPLSLAARIATAQKLSAEDKEESLMNPSHVGITGFFFIIMALTGRPGAAQAIYQLTGTDGCVSETGDGGACADGVGLLFGHTPAVSPDGMNVYVTGRNSNAIAIFDRNPLSGVITQKPGTAGCFSDNGTDGACALGTGLLGTAGVAVSPDGANVYVAATSRGIAVFDRNLTNGVLTQKAFPNDCIGRTPCSGGSGFEGLGAVVVSPDGMNVYAVSGGSNMLAQFDRNPSTGVLTQKAAPHGCLSDSGIGDCTAARALTSVVHITVSPDGKSVYTASGGPNAVAIFDRNTTTGVLTQKAGVAGCVVETPNAGSGTDTCADGFGLRGARWVVVSPDNENVYVGGIGSPSAIAIFDRDTGTGAITQKAGAAGCIGENGDCTPTRSQSLRTPVGMGFNPSGSALYVSVFSNDGVAQLERNLSTGELSQNPARSSCVSTTGSGLCVVAGSVMNAPFGLAVSPDGQNVYVGMQVSNSIGIYAFGDCGDLVLTPDEQCDLGAGNGAAGSCCTASCAFGTTSLQCRPSAGVCDPAETCSGSSAACPADAKSSSVCRPSAGVCDVAESCNGTDNNCPAQGFVMGGTPCRVSTGVCDPAEACTGSSAACPADAKSTAECRPSAGACDVAESCDGVNGACPADGFTSGSTCRASAGVCDPAEICDGTGPACPIDARSTDICRPSSDPCDVAESCDGVNVACPADVIDPDGATCDVMDDVDCSLSDTCQGGICVAGGGGDTDDNGLCDADDVAGLAIFYAYMNVGPEGSKENANGRLRVNGFVDDSGTGGDLPRRIAAGGYELRVRDADSSYDVSIALTGCKLRRNDTQITCKPLRRSHVVLRPTRENPTLFRLRVTARDLPASQTGVRFGGTNPLAAPVAVTLTQGPFASSDSISECRTVAYSTLICRE